jgi:hypothetical protein
VTITFHALWMLCALGAVVFAAAAARRARDLAALSAGFAVAAVLASPEQLPDPRWAGLLAAGAAAVYLFRPRYAILSAAVGGGLAGMWTALLEVQGLPSPAATMLAAAVLILSARLTRVRPVFAPDVLRDEGLLAIGVLGLGAAVLPGVLDGWHAATNLTAVSEREVAAAVPVWTLALLLTSTSLGALYSLWSRR